MTAKISKLLCLILIFSCTSAPAQAGKTGKKYAQKRAEKLFKGTVVTIDNVGGHFWVEAIGDAGSVIRMHINYKGFYVRPLLAMTQAKQGLIHYNPKLVDKYEIVPQSYSVNVTVSTKKICRDDAGVHTKTGQAHLSQNLVMPAPPGVVPKSVKRENSKAAPPRTGADSAAEARWMYNECGVAHKVHNGTVGHNITVQSRQADGGQAYCHIGASIRLDGGKIHFGQSDKGKENVSVRISSLWWMLEGPLLIEKPFSLEDMKMIFHGFKSVAYGCAGYQQTLSDTRFDLRYEFSIAPMVEIKAELEPVDQNEKDWTPTPGETREYKLKLVEPKSDQVQGVKFLLSETSDHKGIVTNGGNHVRGEQCPDCTLGVQEVPWPWETFHKGSFDEVLTYLRHYTHYNECPIDSLPDVYFTDADNPGYDMGGNAVDENLQYTMSQVIETDKINGDTYTVKVRVADGAASTKLSAYVNVGGAWYQADAKGDTASKDKTHLMLPRDENQNSLQDTWEEDNGVGSPDEDKDALKDNPNMGDGLSAFEEYRGIYENGKYRRLFVDYLDVFVFDYASKFRNGLLEVGGRYFRQGINLHVLAESEFKYDLINYVDTDHKNGDQYIMVIMALDQCRNMAESIEQAGRGFLGKAFIGPPGREYNTIVMNKHHIISLDDESKSAADTLGHEIGHGMGLYHHGDTEDFAKIKGERYWVACLGGQHSGDNDCWMRYNIAEKFVDRDIVGVNALGYLVNPFGVVDYIKDYGDYSHFCNTKYGLGQCGDAAKGCCLQNIKVKSY